MTLALIAWRYKSTRPFVYAGIILSTCIEISYTRRSTWYILVHQTALFWQTQKGIVKFKKT